MAFNRAQVSPTGMTGTPASPTTITHGNSNTATFALDTLSSGNKIAMAQIVCTVIQGATAPTVNPTIQFQYTNDGTNYVNDGGAVSVPLGNNAVFNQPYSPPVGKGVIGAQAVVTNGDSTQSITAWAQCNTLAIG